MKVFKSALIAINTLLLFAGCCIFFSKIPEEKGRAALFAAFICSGILNIGYYTYFRMRFVAFSEEICRNAERMVRHDKGEIQINKETLTSKMVMELGKMQDIAWNRLQESEQGKVKLQQTISEISHQLKIPLSNIQMYHDMISEPDITADEAKNFMGILQKQLGKLEFLIDSLVKSSRLESAMIKLDIEDNSIFHMIELAVNGIVKKADKKKIDILVDCRPAIKIPHDVKWTAEAVGNILDNAVKYTKEGGNIHIDVVPGEMYVEIKIRDTGSGISAEHYNDIFKRFYRGDCVSKEEGLGLGLYIARNIITLQGGYIMLHSVLGEGSCFSVFLPNRKIFNCQSNN